MMVELLKLLIEQPESKNKAWLLIIRTILNLIFASNLYVYFIGKYVLIDFSNYTDWHNFIIGGNVLFCILLYFISDLILFQMINQIVDLLLWLLSLLFKGDLKLTNEEQIRGYIKPFSWINLIKYDISQQKIVATDKTAILFEIIQILNNEEGKSQLNSLKTSFANNIIHTCVVSLFILIFCVDIPTKGSFVLGVLTSGMLLLILFYVLIEYFIRLYHLNGNSVQFALKKCLDEKAARDAFKEMGVVIEKDPNIESDQFNEYFRLNDNEFTLTFSFVSNPVKKLTLGTYLEFIDSYNKKIFLITNSANVELDYQLASNENIKIVSYVDQNILQMKLNSFFLNKTMTEGQGIELI